MAADRDRSVEPAQSDVVKLQLRRLALESVLLYRQIRSLVLSIHPVRLSAVCAAQVRGRIQLDR